MRKAYVLLMVLFFVLAVSGCRSGGGSGGEGYYSPSTYSYYDTGSGSDFGGGSSSPSLNPEPSTLALFTLSLLGLFGLKKFRSRH